MQVKLDYQKKQKEPGRGRVFEDDRTPDTYNAIVEVLDPQGNLFLAFVDVWEHRKPREAGKKTFRNVRVRATNWQETVGNAPTGGQVARDTAPAGAPTQARQPAGLPRVGREQGQPPPYNQAPARPMYGHPDDSLDEQYAARARESFNPYDYRDNPQRVGGPDD